MITSIYFTGLILACQSYYASWVPLQENIGVLPVLYHFGSANYFCTKKYFSGKSDRYDSNVLWCITLLSFSQSNWSGCVLLPLRIEYSGTCNEEL